MIRVTDTIAIDEAALEERFIRASGPGGLALDIGAHGLGRGQRVAARQVFGDPFGARPESPIVLR